MEDFRFYASREKGLAEMEVGYSQDILEDIRTVLGKLQLGASSEPSSWT